MCQLLNRGRVTRRQESACAKSGSVASRVNEVSASLGRVCEHLLAAAQINSLHSSFLALLSERAGRTLAYADLNLELPLNLVVLASIALPGSGVPRRLQRRDLFRPRHMHHDERNSGDKQRVLHGLGR